MPIRPPSNPTAAPGQPTRSKFGAPGVAAHIPQRPLIETPQPMQESYGVYAPISPLREPIRSDADQKAAQMGVDIFDIPAEDFNPAAEAAETFVPSPPDDGDHICELALSEGRQDGPYREFTWDQKTKEGVQQRGAVSLALTATISNEQDPFNGRRMYFDINSFGKRAIGAEGSTNDVALVLNALGEQPTGRGKTDCYRVQELVKGGYNKLIVTTEWHANFPYDKAKAEAAKVVGRKDPSKKPYKIGQENFPRDDAGIPQPLHETPSGDILRTIAVPAGFKRLTSWPTKLKN